MSGHGRDTKKLGEDNAMTPESLGFVAWLMDLKDSYGGKLLVMICCAQHLQKGFIGGGGHSGFVGAPMDFIYRAHHLSGPQLQVYSAIALIPWSVKALMGIASDGLPILAYNKGPYVCATTVLAASACVLLGIWHGLSVEVSTGCFFTVFLQIALCDTMVEAKYSEKVKLLPEKGPDLVSFVWCGISVGHLLSTAVVGFVIEHLGPWSSYLFALPFTAVILVPTARNFLEENKVQLHCGSGSKFDGQKAILLVAVVQGCSGLGLAIFSACVRSVRWSFACAAFLTFVATSTFTFMSRPMIAKMNLFFFLNAACAFGTHGATFYFFTDTAEQFPAGPQFSASFYITGVGLVASGCNILGMFLYARWGKRMRYRTIFVIGGILTSVTQLLNVICFTRFNLVFGMPDAVFMITSSALQSVILQFAWMPGTCALAQLVPDGLEATMYALVGSSWNLGMALASYAGALLLGELGVRPRGADREEMQFDRLWLAALIAAFGPCFPLLLIPVLIPDLHQTDKLLLDAPDSATTGSLWEQWKQFWQGVNCHNLEKQEMGGVTSHVPSTDILGAASELDLVTNPDMT